MQLLPLIRAAQPVSVHGPQVREITGIVSDSRLVMPGNVFVALKGVRDDGHNYIPQAVSRGAAAVIAERNGFLPPRLTLIHVRNSHAALAQVAAAFHQHPARKLKTIGVTGTDGKTCVVFLVHHLLERAGVPTGLTSTVHYQVGDRTIPANRSTPPALEMQRMMAHMVQAGCKACVIEASSHGLNQHRLEGIDFDVSVLTNLSPDHLDYHGSDAAYADAKKKLFQAHGSKPGAHVINIDDAFGAHLARQGEVAIRLTYGLHQPATITARQIKLSRLHSRFRLETPLGHCQVTLPLIGRFNIYNALAAVGAGMALDLSLDAIRAGLESAPQVPGRLEAIQCGQPFGVFVDYAHTDHALENVLAALREIHPGRLLLLFGCGGSRDEARRAAMGHVAAEKADAAWITSDNPRQEDPAVIAHQIAAGYRAVRADGCTVELDRAAAIRDVIAQARPEDIVLLAGKGHETVQQFADTVIPFDDRQQAREALEELARRKRHLRLAARAMEPCRLVAA